MAAPHCASCPFAVDGQPRHKPVLAQFPSSEWVPGKGPGEPVIPLGTLLGEYPRGPEVEAGLPFAGRISGEMDDELAKAGLRRSQLLVINAVACRPPIGAKAVDMRAAARCCRPLFREQLKTAYFADPGQYLKAPTLALGSLANFAWHKLMKNRKPPSVKLGRGFVRRNLIVTWHPVHALSFDLWRKGEWVADVNRFARLVRGEIKLLDSAHLHCQPNERAIIRMLAKWLDAGSASVDIETGPLHPDEPWTGKQPMYARLRTIGIGDAKEGFSVCPTRTSPRALEAIKSFLRNADVEKVVMNGWLFDLPILRRHGFEVR